MNVLGDHGCIKKTQKRLMAPSPVSGLQVAASPAPPSPPLPSSRRRKSKKFFTEKKLFTQLVPFDQKITLTTRRKPSKAFITTTKGTVQVKVGRPGAPVPPLANPRQPAFVSSAPSHLARKLTPLHARGGAEQPAQASSRDTQPLLQACDAHAHCGKTKSVRRGNLG